MAADDHNIADTKRHCTPADPAIGEEELIRGISIHISSARNRVVQTSFRLWRRFHLKGSNAMVSMVLNVQLLSSRGFLTKVRNQMPGFPQSLCQYSGRPSLVKDAYVSSAE